MAVACGGMPPSVLGTLFSGARAQQGPYADLLLLLLLYCAWSDGHAATEACLPGELSA